MLALPPPEENPGPESLFVRIITEPDIVSVSRDLFASGHFPLAVQEAFKALEKYLQSKTNSKASGTTLMEQLFSTAKPQLVWSDRVNQSQKDEQAGYLKIFSGAVQGIRNPCTHEFNWIDSAEAALELISIAQHLLRKSKAATLHSDTTSAAGRP